MVNGKWLMGDGREGMGPVHDDRAATSLRCAEAATAAQASHRSPKEETTCAAEAVESAGLASRDARATKEGPLRPAFAKATAGRQAQGRQGKGGCAKTRFLQNEANFLECWTVWIRLRDK
jgi:hypothetical protein